MSRSLSLGSPPPRLAAPSWSLLQDPLHFLDLWTPRDPRAQPSALVFSSPLAMPMQSRLQPWNAANPKRYFSPDLSLEYHLDLKWNEFNTKLLTVSSPLHPPPEFPYLSNFIFHLLRLSSHPWLSSRSSLVSTISNFVLFTWPLCATARIPLASVRELPQAPLCSPCSIPIPSPCAPLRATRKILL